MGGEGIAGAFALLVMLVVCTRAAFTEGGIFIAFAGFFWYLVVSLVAWLLIERYEDDNQDLP